MNGMATTTSGRSSTVETMNFRASDITSTVTIEARDIQSGAPASAVAKSLATSMRLPENVPYGLRNDFTSEFLDDFRPIGDQIEQDTSVTVVPKTHLG